MIIVKYFDIKMGSAAPMNQSLSWLIDLTESKNRMLIIPFSTNVPLLHSLQT